MTLKTSSDCRAVNPDAEDFDEVRRGPMGLIGTVESRQIPETAKYGCPTVSHWPMKLFLVYPKYPNFINFDEIQHISWFHPSCMQVSLDISCSRCWSLFLNTACRGSAAPRRQPPIELRGFSLAQAFLVAGLMAAGGETWRIMMIYRDKWWEMFIDVATMWFINSHKPSWHLNVFTWDRHFIDVVQFDIDINLRKQQKAVELRSDVLAGVLSDSFGAGHV